MLNKKTSQLQTFAKNNDFMFIDADLLPDVASFFRKEKKSLKKRTKQNFWSRLLLLLSIQRVRSKNTSSADAIVQTYNQEYSKTKGRYGYLSLMLSKKGFTLITKLSDEIIKKLHVLDVGAGSNEFLRFCRDSLLIPSNQLIGADISEESCRIIEQDGFQSYQGRTETLPLPNESLDLVYLSYFIDYDTHQLQTFGSAIDLVKPGGLIVLEGWFPVQPFAFLKKDIKDYTFVTKGKSVEEDIDLVRKAFVDLGRSKNKTVLLQQVVKTHRFVNSHYGFHKLPSYFLTFRVN